MPATVFIRHAQSVSNHATGNDRLEAEIAHLTDAEFVLSDEGIAQAQSVAGLLDGVDATLHCSSYIRAQMTAKIIHPSYYWNVHDQWRERSWGDWLHLRWEERERQAGIDIRAFDFLPPGADAESRQMVIERVTAAMETLDMTKNNIIVAHGALMVMAAYAVNGKSPESPQYHGKTLPNLSMIRIEDGEWRYYEPGDRAAVADMVI